MPLLETLFILFVGGVLGVLAHWLWRRGGEAALAELRSERDRLGQSVEALGRSIAQEQALRAAAEERASRIVTLEGELKQAATLRADNASLLASLDAERRQGEEKIRLLLEAKETLTEQFRNLANQIFEDKGEKFVKQNAASLDGLLKPLAERLKEFQGRVEETYDKESKQRFSLQAEIQRLVELNVKMSVDAVNLTNALKGESKTQGTWGEMILERVLESSGLQKGREYDVQVSLVSDDGRKLQPDVVVRLPENKHVVVDSKVSLTAYEAYNAADDETKRNTELARHIASVRGHIDELSKKNYQALSGLRAPDYVLMFVPVEPALVLVAKASPDLFAEAMKKNVMIVSPTTLLIALRTIASIWRYEYQNRNAQELVRQCTAMYEKFVNFVSDLEDVGKKIDAAQKSYEDAHNKLSSGKGSLTQRAERIRELGLKPGKLLPSHLAEPESVDGEAEVRSASDGKASTK